MLKHRRLPFSLLFAAALLILTMAAGSYVDLRYEEMHSRQLAISTGLEKIDRFNQQLSAMLLVSVLEQNILKSSSYQNVHAKLELDVGMVESLTQGLSLADDVTALSQERRNLRQVELNAYKLMEQEHWQAARTLLFGDEYVLARKIYEINSETAIGALNGELTTNAARFNQIRNISLGLRFAALGLLFWAGMMFSQRLRHELKEQERLREEITSVNIQLEEKVQERTAELEEANRKLADLSITDGLTGLANRRHFDEVFKNEWHRAKRQHLPVSIAMIDVDQFKLYNDHFGHQEGDACLRRIAAVLSESVQRSGDLMARYGGEEFVAILPGMKGSDAVKMAEIIRQRVQAEKIAHSDTSLSGIVTVSIGVGSRIPQSSDAAVLLLNEADTALYTAKNSGRNTVVLLDGQAAVPADKPE
ncbi:MAG: diguanylate cyclase [Desulfobacteraceae bacterium]|nr:MAG: diguanylate cyclase [Desulfobacteraceae bacterium]